MTADEMNTLVKALTDGLRPFVEDEARRRCDEVLQRVLGSDADLHARARAAVDEAIRDAVARDWMLTVTAEKQPS